MLDLLGPVQIGDMHEAVDPFLDADKYAEVRDIPHRAFNAAADWIFFLRRLPGFCHHLLEPERDSAVSGIELEHDDFDLFADSNDLRRVIDAPPRHVADVENAVDAAEIDESAIAGNVLHCAFEDHALLENF